MKLVCQIANYPFIEGMIHYIQLSSILIGRIMSPGDIPNPTHLSRIRDKTYKVYYLITGCIPEKMRISSHLIFSDMPHYIQVQGRLRT